MNPIGARITEVCEIVEAHGICISPYIREIMGVTSSGAATYLSRAVGLRLLTVDRTTRPHEYRVIDGWREIVRTNHLSKTRKPRPQPIEVRRPLVNSVFNFGACA